MTVQRLHSAFAPIDVLTRSDLEAIRYQWLEEAMRVKLRGLEIARFPRVIGTSVNGGTFNLFANPDESPSGPSQGDIWMVRRIIVKAVISDLATYQLYRGSAPSDTQNAYTMPFLLEGFSPGFIPGSVTNPGIGTSPSTYVNTNNFPVNVHVAGGTVTSIAVNGQVITGVTSGTFTLQSGSYITVTYTVAPTVYTIVNAQSFVFPGQTVNLGYYPGTKAIFLQPGEQIYAQLFNTTAGNQYQLDGEAIRVPAEMKGKVL